MANPVETAIGIVQRRSLRRNTSKVPTGILPLSQVRRAVALIDVEDTSFDHCKNIILTFFRRHGIHIEIFYLDFRRLGEGERLITSINGTILKKDLNWFGRPSDEKLRLLEMSEPDMLISAIREKDFAYQYIVASSPARFKVGRKQLPGNLFDIVLSEPDDKVLSEADAFANMAQLLEKIR